MQAVKKILTINDIEHEVEVVDVSDDEIMCGVAVDGDVAWVHKGSGEHVNGVYIYVEDTDRIEQTLQNVDVCDLRVHCSDETFDLKIPDELKKEVVDGCTVLYWVILNDKVMKQIKAS